MKQIVFASLSMIALCSASLVLAQPKSDAPIGVYVAPVKSLNFVDKVEALGSLKANQNVALASTVTELITAVKFDDGQRVKQGDVLIEMDASEEQAQLAEERIRVGEARRSVDRFKPLIKRGAAAEASLDESQSSLRAAEARIKAIESRIAQRKITAPFDGVVGLRNVSVGALAQPGTMITTIDDDSVMKLDFSVPEVFLEQLKPGVDIEATTSAYPGKTYRGKLASVDSRVDVVTRSIIVRALLENTDRSLKPGLLMRVVLKRNPRSALVVQEEAIVVDGQDSFVMLAVAKDNGLKAEQRMVKLGARREGEVEVLSGLQADDQVIVHGSVKLRDGAAIKILAVEQNNETLTELIDQQTDGTGTDAANATSGK